MTDTSSPHPGSSFEAHVRDYVDLVYATARRLVGDAHLAEDVTQATFVVLARKQATVSRATLAGWLVNTARLVAKEAIRSKLCRAKHEARAVGMRSRAATSPDEPTVDEITPLLDDALAQLADADRAAVVMRFLQGMSLADVGNAMGTSEDAARKRVSRAVERLRKIFLKQGIAPSAGGLMVALAAQQSSAVAPTGLATKVAATSLSGAASQAASTGVALANSLIATHVTPLIKVAVAVAAAGLFIASGIAITNRLKAVPNAAAPTTSATTAPATTTTTFIGRLSDSTSVELVGVNENPTEGKPWWRADGSPLVPGPYKEIPNRLSLPPPARSIQLLLRFSGVDGRGQPWSPLNLRWAITAARPALAARTDEGKRVPGEYVVLAAFPEQQDRVDLLFRFAIDASKTAVSLLPAATGAERAAQVAEAEVPGIGHVILSNPREVDGAAVVTAMIPTPPSELQVVVRAISNALPRRPVSSTSGPALGGTDNERRDIHYSVPLAQVEEFRIEMRDYSRFIEFRDVSLKPGAKTDAEVVTSESVPATQPRLR